MEFITTDLVNIIMYILPFDQLNVLIAFFLLSLVSVGMMFSLVTMATFYLSLFVMVVSTIQILKAQRAKPGVLAGAQLLRKFNPQLDPDTVVAEYDWNNLRPYYSFFTSLLMCVTAFILVNKEWVPCSEFTAASLAISVVCLIILTDFNEPIVLFSLALDVLSSLPHLLSDFPEIPLVTPIINLLSGELTTIPITPHFYLSISLPALGQIILPFLFLHIASKNSWQGTYRILFPHLINFFWWQLGVMFFLHSSWLGLARGSLGWLGVLILLPLLAVGSLISGIVYIIFNFSFYTVIKIMLPFLLFAVPVGHSLWQEAGFSLGDLSLRGRSLKAKFLAILLPVILLGSFMTLAPSDEEVQPQYVSWNLYREMCGKPAWEKTNVATAQINCEVFR